MSEPCKHERFDADVREHGALGAAHLEIQRLEAVLAGPCAHTALSRIYLEERDEARATIVERDASIAQLATRLAADDQDATIERVRALAVWPVAIENFGGSTHWADCHRHHRDCLILAIRAALEPSS